MKKIYVIDACALIDAAQHYNMTKKSFSNIWDALDELIQKGELISSTEIMDELKDEDLKNWVMKKPRIIKFQTYARPLIFPI